MNAAISGLVVLLCFCQATSDHDSQNAQELELLALDHYKGSWDCEFTIESQTDEGKDKNFSGVVQGKWFVGGKFLEQIGKYQLDGISPPFVIMTMMSFDKKQNRYQYDYFNSSGDIQRSFGNWDTVTKTMTSTLTDNGKVTTIVADFSTDDVERWIIETKNEDEKVITRIRGKNTRRKDK